MENRQNNFQYRSSPLGGIVGLLVILGILYLLFMTVKGVWSILAFLAPILFIIAMILRFRVVTDYGKMLWNTIKEEPIRGIAYSVLSVIGFPAVSAFLFFKAFTLRKVEKMAKPKYDEYEEIAEDEDFLELPEMEIQEQTKDASSSDYEELFD
jgi:uncharacterized membrane protein